MSRLTLTMKSLLALGAATAITITASADVTKPTQPATEQAKSAVAGGGAGKANFQDLSVTAKGGDIESEGDLALNAAAPNDKIGPIYGESQDRAAAIKLGNGIAGETVDKATVTGGEDRLTENVSIASGPNGMMPEVDLDARRPIGGNDPISGIDIIVKRPAPVAIEDHIPNRARPMQRR